MQLDRHGIQEPRQGICFFFFLERQEVVEGIIISFFFILIVIIITAISDNECECLYMYIVYSMCDLYVCKG